MQEQQRARGAEGRERRRRAAGRRELGERAAQDDVRDDGGQRRDDGRRQVVVEGDAGEGEPVVVRPARDGRQAREERELLAPGLDVVGDGAETLFRRIVRGARDAGDVGVVVSPANEWTIPETNECLRSNAPVFGAAVARVDALRHERLLETLEASLASSSRGLEYAPRRTRAAAEDVDIDPFLSTACEIGLERARRASASTTTAASL